LPSVRKKREKNQAGHGVDGFRKKEQKEPNEQKKNHSRRKKEEGTMSDENSGFGRNERHRFFCDQKHERHAGAGVR